ncbi:MAG: tetratricopeptide repeat protein [Terriglobia bacterium]
MSSYYHFMLARRYSELAGIYNSTADLDRAISEFKKAIADDPGSLYLHAQLGDLYWRAGMTPQAVSEAESVLKQSPNDLDAHRLLGSIYVHNLGQDQSQTEQKANLEKAIHEYEAVTHLAPDDTRSAVLLGRLYWLDNQPANAEKSFKTVLGAHPDSASALNNLGKLLMEQDQYKQSIGVLERIPESQRGPTTLAMLGMAYSETGSLDKAVSSYKAALELDPEKADVRREYADALMRSGKLQPARQQLEQVVKANPQDGLAYLRLAQINQAEGSFPEAEKDLAQARTAVPDDPEVTYQEALLQAATGHAAKAIEILQGLLSQTQKSNGKYSAAETTNRGIFLERLGIIYQKQQKYDEAIATFRQMEALGGSDGPSAEGLVIETLELQGQRQKALDEARQALKKHPENRSLVLEESSLLGELGHVNEAVKELRALERGNPDPRVELAVAQVYSGAKHYREAEDTVKDVLGQSNLKAGDQETAEFVLGAVYEHQKKYALAQDQFNKVLASDPVNAEAYNYLGYMLADRGVQLDQSVQYIKKALQLDPNNAAFLDSLGWAYYKLGRYDLALPPLERAARMLSTDPTVLAHLGRVYLKLGREREAAEQWRQALKEWPDAADTDFDAAQAAKLQKDLSQIERRISKAEPNR